MSHILKNTKVLIFIIAILLIANIVILILFMGAKQPPYKGDRSRDRPGFSEFLKNDIKFNSEQLKQYDSLKKIYWKAAWPIFKGLNTAKDSFYVHIKDTVISEPVIMMASDSIAFRQQKMDLFMFSHFRNVRDLCTYQQKPLYDSLIQNMIKKMMNPYRRDNRSKGPEHGRKQEDSVHRP